MPSPVKGSMRGGGHLALSFAVWVDVGLARKGHPMEWQLVASAHDCLLRLSGSCTSNSLTVTRPLLDRYSTVYKL